MATTNITMRIDEQLKAQLQDLMSKLGLDMTTFFTMAAKQAVREQALPFQPNLNKGIYGIQAYKAAMANTKYNKEGKPVISSDDEWAEESEWDETSIDTTYADDVSEKIMKQNMEAYKHLARR